MSNQKVMSQITAMISELHVDVMEGKVTDQEAISERLQSICDLAEENDLPLILDDNEYTRPLGSNTSQKSVKPENSYDNSPMPTHEKEPDSYSY